MNRPGVAVYAIRTLLANELPGGKLAGMQLHRNSATRGVLGQTTWLKGQSKAGAISARGTSSLKASKPGFAELHNKSGRKDFIVVCEIVRQLAIWELERNNSA